MPNHSQQKQWPQNIFTAHTFDIYTGDRIVGRATNQNHDNINHLLLFTQAYIQVLEKKFSVQINTVYYLHNSA